MHRHAAPRERQRDPAGSDAELQRAPTPGKLREQVHDRLDDLRFEHVCCGLVVA
jgi:hypothetical protein